MKPENEFDVVSRKFVLESIDPETDCIVGVTVFETTDVAGLAEIVDPGENEIHPGYGFYLEPEQVEKIADRFRAKIETTGVEVQLRSWDPMDELPYPIHTGRELAMMLTGSKPLSVFCDYFPFEFIPASYFDPYVQSGLLTKNEFIIDSGNGRELKYVLYARAEEEWRMKAYRLLRLTGRKTGWSEGFERMEGTLLGYEEWQNDIYIERIYSE